MGKWPLFKKEYFKLFNSKMEEISWESKRKKKFWKKRQIK